MRGNWFLQPRTKKPEMNESIGQFFSQSQADWNEIEAHILSMAADAIAETGGSPTLARLAEILPLVFTRVQAKIAMCKSVCVDLAGAQK